MFYNDFILVFIEKYQQKYQQNILLHQDYIKFTARLPKGFIGITTARLRQGFMGITTSRLGRFVDKYARAYCAENSILSV